MLGAAVERRVALFAVVTTILVAVAAFLTSGCGASSAAAEASAAPDPPAWLLEDMTRQARNCGDAHASAWWTLTTAGRAAVVEGGDIDELSRNTDRPVFAYVIHGDFTRWIWSSPSGAKTPSYSWVVAVLDAKSHIADVVGNSAKPFDTSGLTMHPAVLAATPSPQPATSAFNVTGSVRLQQADGERPGSGLTVTARSERSHRPSVRVRTMSDGSFQLSLKPGWYLLTVDYWGEPALQINVPKVGIAFAPISAPARELAQTTRVSVNDPPSLVPPHGVWLDGHLVLMEPVWPEVSAISRAKAVAAALDGGKPARAVLATVSAPQRMLGPKQPMVDWLTWVVVRDLPRPIDCVVGGYVPKGTPRTPGLVTHSVSLIDAKTGRFLLGFFTK